jgi:class 3 adenylate cyclase
LCPACAAPAAVDQRFCGKCGTSLGQLDVGGDVLPDTSAVSLAERRVCSVLFADLVGFTSISEGRDVEIVRELLSEYFEVARTVIARYGGVVEKFIGDAVMAVWGVPRASADDAERAVRAALELLDAVAALGESTGTSALALGPG